MSTSYEAAARWIGSGCAVLAVGAFALSVTTAIAAPQPRRSYAPLAGEGIVSVHDPFDSEECTSCHAERDDGLPGPVEEQGRALCLTCHDDPAEGSAHRHGGETGRCLDCHQPHNSRQPSLLLDAPRVLCTGCHTNVASDLAVGKAHAPLATDRSCLTCHLPHGSSDERQLSLVYVQGLYANYSVDTYALCFSCHKSALVDANPTRTATKFRDGELNLHQVHVVKGDRGRSCKACHSVHAAAPGAHLVADEVAFGSHGWKLKLNYKPEATGGSCAKTCHQMKSYDRSR